MTRTGFAMSKRKDGSRYRHPVHGRKGPKSYKSLSRQRPKPRPSLSRQRTLMDYPKARKRKAIVKKLIKKKAPPPKPKPKPQIKSKVEKIKPRQKPRVQIPPKPAPVPKGKPIVHLKPRATGKEGVLPKAMAQKIILARMAKAYPNTDYETIVENMMDNYDSSVTFNENMNSLSKHEFFKVYPEAFHPVKDYEIPASEVEQSAQQKEAVIKEIRDKLDGLPQQYPEEFMSYLSQEHIVDIEGP